MKKILILLFLSFWAYGTQRTATPSGGDVSTPLQTAINASSNGDTILIPACTTNWVNTVTLSNKWVTVIGAGTGHTKVVDDTVGGRTTGYPAITVYDSVGQPFHFKGINFVFTVENIFWIQGSSKTWHIDSCIFNFNGNNLSERHGISAGFINGADTVTTAGLCNWCLFINCGSVTYAGKSGYNVWRDPLKMGTQYCPYFEDDSVVYNQGYSQAHDENYGGQAVWRYSANVNATWEVHSVQGWNSGASLPYYSGRSFESYKNRFYAISNGASGPNTAHRIRGGTGVIFNNTITNSLPDYKYQTMAWFDNVRSQGSVGAPLNACDGTNGYDGNIAGQSGYPCLCQIGRSNGVAVHQDSVPYYMWGNSSGTSGLTTCGSDTNWIKQGRDFVVTPPPMGTYYALTYPHPLSGQPPSMVVSSVSPISGLTAAKDTINGSGFQASQGNGYVAFNGSTLCSIISWSNTKIAYTVPTCASAAYKVYVINNDFQVDSSQTFTNTSCLPPTITGFTATCTTGVAFSKANTLGGGSYDSIKAVSLPAGLSVSSTGILSGKATTVSAITIYPVNIYGCSGTLYTDNDTVTVIDTTSQWFLCNSWFALNTNAMPIYPGISDTSDVFVYSAFGLYTNTCSSASSSTGFSIWQRVSNWFKSWGAWKW